MGDTIILTGANGSLALPTIDRLLTNHPEHHLILTVRDASDADANTQKLRDIIAQHPESKTSIFELDLASLPATNEFVDHVVQRIADKTYPPVKAIICNAHYWDLVGDPQITEDGYEKTLQVCHISHTAIVLRLLSQFGPGKGRVLLLSSLAHWGGKSGMEKIPPELPDDLDALNKPISEPDNYSRGFQRYGNAKLAVTTWGFALNRRLQEDPNLNRIFSVVYNPGQLVDSRGLYTRTPQSVKYMASYLFQPFRPVLRWLDSTIQTPQDAAVDVCELTLSPAYADEIGYYVTLAKADCNPVSLDKEVQDKLWIKSAAWAGVSAADSALGYTF